jgi:simple sugar transport system permease protein
MTLSNKAKAVLVHLGGSIAAILLAFAVSAVLMLMVRVSPLLVYGKLFEGVFLNPYGLAQIFFKATPLMLAGLSVAFAFHAGLFNIGAEGQMIVGGFLCALAAYYVHLPWILHVPLCILVAMLGGVLWAVIPAYLKAYRGAHEVITTIMMNFIAAALTGYFVAEKFHEPETVHTFTAQATSFIPRLSVMLGFCKGSPANMSFILALLACGAVYWLLWKIPLGYEIRAFGLNSDAAATAGINVRTRLIYAFLISGALAGLASVNFVLGYKHYYEEGFSSGVGFMGIAVALVGQNNPVGVAVAALLFGALSHATLVINGYVPKDIVEVMQALVIIFVIVLNGVTRKIVAERFGDR